MKAGVDFGAKNTKVDILQGFNVPDGGAWQERVVVTKGEGQQEPVLWNWLSW
jgi:hypothetical protein